MSSSDRLLEGGADLSSMGGCSSAARIVSVINSRTGEVPLGGRHVRGVGAPTAPPLHSHGHVDHVGGTAPFDAEEMRPTVVAREAIAARFDRYRATAGYNSRINQRQFTAPGLTWPTEYRYPDRTYRDRVTLRRGELTFELEHARGETDDHTRVWVPELVDRALDDTARLLETLCRQTHGGGTLLSLLELRFTRPGLDGDEAAANLAEMVLRMLGLPPDNAREVARRPLPDLP
ncbi:hypothetical protein [Actinomadura welshii]|uniref:hypothetical protein n=1 Tax=Actinomadura welshii TaxID=3103817 RepID=UPI00190F3955|nr:hypothetical protein [Actinomadura madurae]